MRRSDSYVVGIGEAIDDSIPNSDARTQIMIGLTAIGDRIFADGFGD